MARLMKMKRSDLRNTGIDKMHAVTKIEVATLQGLRIDELSTTAAAHIPNRSKWALPTKGLAAGEGGEGAEAYGAEDDDVDEDYEDFRVKTFRGLDSGKVAAGALRGASLLLAPPRAPLPSGGHVMAPREEELSSVLRQAAALLASAEADAEGEAPPLASIEPEVAAVNSRRKSWRDVGFRIR